MDVPPQENNTQQDITCGKSASNLAFSHPPWKGLTSGMLPSDGDWNSLEMGILKGKVNGLERELIQSKEDMLEVTKRYHNQLSGWNNQRNEYQQMTQKYTDSQMQITDLRQRASELEEVVMIERRSVLSLREELHNMEDQRRQAESTSDKLRQELTDLRQRYKSDIRRLDSCAVDHVTRDSLVEAQKGFDVRLKAFAVQCQQIMDRLSLAHDEEKSNVFIARSAVLSAVSTMESKLAQMETSFQALLTWISQWKMEEEDELRQAMDALMTENHALWGHVARLQQQSRSIYSGKEKLSESIPAINNNLGDDELRTAEEKLQHAKETIEKYIAATERHEETVRTLQREKDSLQRELAKQLEYEGHFRETIQSNDSEKKELEGEIQHIRHEWQLLQSQHSECESQHARLQQRLQDVRVGAEAHCRAEITKLTEERNTLESLCTEMRRELDDIRHNMLISERKASQLQEALNQQNSQAETLMASQTTKWLAEKHNADEHWKNELCFLHNTLQQKSSALEECERRLCDTERVAENLRKSIRFEEETVRELRQSQLQQQELMRQMETKSNKLQLELETIGPRLSEAEKKYEISTYQIGTLKNRERILEQNILEVEKVYQETLKEGVKQRVEYEKIQASLQDEIGRLKIHKVDMENVKVLREKTEREKTQLMQENIRLHEEINSLQANNIELTKSLQDHRYSKPSDEAISQRFRDLEDRLLVLPELQKITHKAQVERDLIRNDLIKVTAERDALAEKLSMSQKYHGEATTQQDTFRRSGNSFSRDDSLTELLRKATDHTKRLDAQIDLLEKNK